MGLVPQVLALTRCSSMPRRDGPICRLATKRATDGPGCDHAGTVTSRVDRTLAGIECPILGPIVTTGAAGLDGLRLASVPFVPGVRLYLAEDAIVLGARLEAEHGRPMPPPFWADAWVGGQAVARYIVDHPE